MPGLWTLEQRRILINKINLAIRNATAKDIAVSQKKLYYVVAMEDGLSEKKFNEYIDFLVGGNFIKKDGDTLIANMEV